MRWRSKTSDGCSVTSADSNDSPICYSIGLVEEALASSPPRDEIRILVVPLKEPTAATDALDECLTADERGRAERYRFAKARYQFVTGRGLLRRVLGAWLGVTPAAVPITYSSAGKPLLASADSAIHFNISHTDGLALIAFASRPIGIDVERIREVSNPDGLVDRFFSRTECDAYRNLAGEWRSAGFFRGWTCKEAVLKARGLSVALLNEFDVEVDPQRPARIIAARHPQLLVGTWDLVALDVADGYAAALAVADVQTVEAHSAGNGPR